MSAQAARNPALVCPACGGRVAGAGDQYGCRDCMRLYPVLFGIPDFRLRGDRYLSLEDERAKAARLYEFGRTHSFAELVNFYYEITDDVPPHLAARFSAYVFDGPARAGVVLEEVGGPRQGSPLLDLGCGSGGALVAASELGFAELVGVDIGLRWLVICRKRLEEAGVDALLLCADAEDLPLQAGHFSHVIADDLLDHVRSPKGAFAAAAAQLREGGKLWVTGTSRWWPGPHPSVGIWAAGLMPPLVRGWIGKRLTGIDVLRNATFLSPGRIKRWARNGGLEIVEAGPRRFDMSLVRRWSAWQARAASVYHLLARVPGLRQLLYAAGPGFRLIARRPDKESS